MSSGKRSRNLKRALISLTKHIMVTNVFVIIITKLLGMIIMVMMNLFVFLCSFPFFPVHCQVDPTNTLLCLVMMMKMMMMTMMMIMLAPSH